MSRVRHFSPEKVEQAQRLKAEGLSYRKIAATIGVSCCSIIKSWLDSDYAASRRARIKVNMAQRYRCKTAKIQKAVENSASRLMRQIPPDTRDLTARLCGDPLPGRRAIDRMEMSRSKHEVPFQ